MYETATDMYHEEAQNPEDEQNHRDRPQHVFFLDKGLASLALTLGNTHTATTNCGCFSLARSFHKRTRLFLSRVFLV